MATYYVSTTGHDGNPGTISSPWASWHSAWRQLSPGDTLLIRGGTYTTMYNTSLGVWIKPSSGAGSDGTFGSVISVMNYPGEIPILDCSALTSSGEHDGIEMEGVEYWNISGLTVINSKERGAGLPSPGWTLQTCSNISITQCVLHDNDNGFISYWGNEVYYTNCDAYHNGETYEYFGNNGFYGCVADGGTTYWTGCRSYLNGQDGFDSFAGDGGDGYLYWDKCWAFSNGTLYDASSGFKMGLSGVPAPTYDPMRIVTNCISADQPCGYDESQDTGVEKHAYSYSHSIYNCVSYGNTLAFAFAYGAGVVGGDTDHPDIIKNCISYGDTYITYTGFGANTVSDNSWDLGTFGSGDFTNTELSQLSASRKSDGSLPIITAFHLSAAATDFIHEGANVSLTLDGEGKAYANPTPSIGAYEYGAVVNIPVTAVTVTGAGSAITISTDNGTLQMSAHCDPHDATNQTVTWSVHPGTGQATITQGGLLTAVENGTVIVLATPASGLPYQGYLEITISNQVASSTVLIQDLNIIAAGDASTIITYHGTLQFTVYEIIPSNATDQTVTWSITDLTGSATVTQNGLVTAVSNGFIQVYATANDGSGAYGRRTIQIYGQDEIEALTITSQGGATSINIKNGTIQLYANRAVTWSVQNGTGSAVIDQNGLLRALSNGTVKVIATE